MNIAIIYASHDGHTKKICETIANHLNDRYSSVDLIAVEDFTAKDLERYNGIVFGAAVRYGKHLKSMTHFIKNHQHLLNEKTTAFFSVNLTARKANRNTPETSNYVKKFLASVNWQPDVVDVFAGKLNYPSYRFFDKYIIRFIMWLTKGDTDLNSVREYTDWQRVEAFSHRLKENFNNPKKQ